MRNHGWIMAVFFVVFLSIVPPPIEIPLIEGDNVQIIFSARGVFDCSVPPDVKLEGTIISRNCSDRKIRIVSNWNGGGSIDIPSGKWDFIQVDLYNYDNPNWKTKPAFQKKWPE